MSDEEVRRAGVLKRVKAGELTQVEAAERLALSYRQVKRVYGRFVEGGSKAMVDRSAGKPASRGHSMWIGRACINRRRHRGKSGRASCRFRSLGACARSWGSS